MPKELRVAGKYKKEDEVKTRIFTVLAVLTLTGFVPIAAPVHAGTNVNVNLGIPAPVVVAPQPVYVEQPPEMVVIPRSNVYFAPGVSVDLFFYDNRWWNRRGDRWYRGSGYNGPWVAVGPRHVPGPVYRVPANYRTVYGHEKPMPYGQWKKAHGEHGGKHRGEMHGNKRGHHDD
ncbi:MAG TPA: hypothetical protein VF905_09795 [Nitrospirota bacterium]